MKQCHAKLKQTLEKSDSMGRQNDMKSVVRADTVAFEALQIIGRYTLDRDIRR